MNMAIAIEVEKPRPRTRRDDQQDALAEGFLLSWGEWCQTKLIAQGFGGGVDYENGKIPRAPGTHGNPVLAELLAADLDGQGIAQQVHDIIGRYTKDWRKVAWARWVGCQEPTGWQKITQRDSIEIGAGLSFPMNAKFNCVTTWKWSGLQTFAEVAQQTKIPLRTCERIAAQIKRLIVLDMGAAQHGPKYHDIP